MEIHKDKRGKIEDIFIRKDAAVAHVTFEEGAIRGNHYHSKTVQCDLVVSGKLLCRGFKTRRVVHPGEVIVFNPGSPHAYKALEKSEIITLTYGPRKGEQYASDTYEYILLKTVDNGKRKGVRKRRAGKK